MKNSISFKILTAVSLVFSANALAAEPQQSYVGKSFTSKVPLLYMSNLHYCDEVPEYIARNSYCLRDKQANYELVEVRPNCTNCIDSERMLSPIRMKYVPANTSFKIIKEYIIEPESFMSGPIDMLVLKDDQGNVSEAIKLGFSLMMENDRKSREDMYAEMLAEADYKFREFCVYDQITPNYDVNKLLEDFELTKSVTTHSFPCPGGRPGIDFRFKDTTSYMTLFYFIGEWGISGTWR